MFTDDKVFMVAAALINGLVEVGGEAPEVFAFMGLEPHGITTDQFNYTVSVMVSNELLERTPGPKIRITDNGRKLALALAAVESKPANEQS